VKIVGIEREVIICADFYKMIMRPKEELGLTQQQLDHIKALPLSKRLSNLHSVPYTGKQS
jgi:hypothetical protein